MDLNLQDGTAGEVPLLGDGLWAFLPPCRSSQSFRCESKKLIRQLVALEERAFTTTVAEWIATLDQLKNPELATFTLQTGLCGNDLEFLNLRCAIALRGREFYDKVRSGQWSLAAECLPEVSVWIGLSELVIGVLWVASYERASNFTWFDQLFTDDDYLHLLMTTFFAPSAGDATARGSSELVEHLTHGMASEEASAMLQTIEEAMDKGERLPWHTLPGNKKHLQEMVVPGLGRVRQGSVLRDRHGEKCWVYSVAGHASGGTEIMVLRRRGRASTVLRDAGTWQLVST